MSRRSRMKSAMSNSALYGMLTKITYGRFKWTNLPYGLTSIQLEKFISNWSDSSHAAGAMTDDAGPVILPAYDADMRNLYFLPQKQILTGCDFDRIIDIDQCSVFYENSSRRSLFLAIEDTAQKLQEIWHTMSLNTRQQRNPWAFFGNEDEIQSIRAALTQVEENQGYILATREISDLVKQTAGLFFPTQVGYICDTLMEQYMQVLNQYLTRIGMDNVPIMKKERLLSAEANSNNQLVLYNRDDCVRMREEAAEKFVQLTGVNINVEWTGGEIIDAAVDNGGTVLPVSGYDE